LPDQLLFSKI